MKTPLSFLALALAGSACTPQSTAQDASGQVEKAPAVATATANAAGVPGPSTIAAPALPGKLALLQKVDLSAAFYENDFVS